MEKEGWKEILFMSDFNHLIGQNVKIEVSGETELCGKLIDAGLDILVIYNKQYYYLPFAHIQRIKPDPEMVYDWDVTFHPEATIKYIFRYDILSKSLNECKRNLRMP